MKIHYTLKVGDNIMKILLLTFDKHEEKAIADCAGYFFEVKLLIKMNVNKQETFS